MKEEEKKSLFKSGRILAEQAILLDVVLLG
jgi:hypothetical protein